MTIPSLDFYSRFALSKHFTRHHLPTTHLIISHRLPPLNIDPNPQNGHVSSNVTSSKSTYTQTPIYVLFNIQRKQTATNSTSHPGKASTPSTSTCPKNQANAGSPRRASAGNPRREAIRLRWIRAISVVRSGVGRRRGLRLRYCCATRAWFSLMGLLRR